MMIVLSSYIKSKCATNPLLLSVWVNTLKDNRCVRVKETVWLYLQQNLKFDDGSLAAFNIERFIDVQMFFYMASSSQQLSDPKLSQYKDTWLYEHDIFILEDSVLKVNFPQLSIDLHS